MGAMKLPSEDVSCHESLWQWMERFRKHSSKPTLFLVHASCSASFRRLKPPLRLPGDQKCLCWIKRAEKDAACCGDGGKEAVDRWRSDSSPTYQVTEQEETAFRCARRGLDGVLWKISSPKALSSAAQGSGGITIPGTDLKMSWCPLGTWFSAGLMVGLDDLRDLFQAKRFHDLKELGEPSQGWRGGSQLSVFVGTHYPQGILLPWICAWNSSCCQRKLCLHTQSCESSQERLRRSSYISGAWSFFDTGYNKYQHI